MVKKVVLEVGDFALVSRDVLKEMGIARGTTVYLAGSAMIPSKTDPYNYRKIFLLALVEDGHVIVDDDSRKGFLFDAKNLRKIKGKRDQLLRETLKRDFEPEEEVDSDPVLN